MFDIDLRHMAKANIKIKIKGKNKKNNNPVFLAESAPVGSRYSPPLCRDDGSA